MKDKAKAVGHQMQVSLYWPITLGLVMRQKIRDLLTEQKGQGMTEYIIIIALVAVGSIVVLKAFGTEIKKYFQTVLDALK